MNPLMVPWLLMATITVNDPATRVAFPTTMEISRWESTSKEACQFRARSLNAQANYFNLPTGHKIVYFCIPAKQPFLLPEANK